LLANSTATVFAPAALIPIFGPVSGAHFNPVVSIADWWLGRRAGSGLRAADLGPYLLAQIAGGDQRVDPGQPDVRPARRAPVHQAALGRAPVAGYHGAQARHRGGENAVVRERTFAGSLGTQVVKVFDLVAAGTGRRDHEATTAGFTPVSSSSTTVADDHKAYHPGTKPVTITATGDADTGGCSVPNSSGTATPPWSWVAPTTRSRPRHPNSGQRPQYRAS
jgi:hypothetical protein